MPNNVTLKWKKLSQEAQVPELATKGAACFDLTAALEAPMTVKKGEVAAVPTGLSVEIPEGFEMQLRARSGLAFKHGLTLVNGVGTIDSDYRGEVKVLVTLLAAETLEVKNGDRIAQALVAPVLTVLHEEVKELSDTERGAGGFGSTGVNASKEL
ncbi:dUTP diphosphatase [bacterium]|nr:dUTP diphosphatase [bacterium]